jgi:hypothetical protein
VSNTVRQAPSKEGRNSNVRRWITSMVAVALTVLMFGVHSSTALGSEIKRGDQIDVPSGTTIDDDLYIVARRAVIQGSVTGDVTAATAFLNTVGSIGGNLTVASGRVDVRGPVGGDVWGLGAIIAIYGNVAGNVIVAGGMVTLVEGAEVAGDLVILGGQVQIIKDATVGGEVRGAGLSVTVEGHIAGNLDLTVRRLHLAPGAEVDRALRYRSGRDARIETGALVAGPIARRDVAELLPFGPLLLWSGGAVLRLLTMIIAGGAMLLVSPRGVVAAADKCRTAPLETSLVGIVLGLVVPVLLVLMALTVIGLPPALMGAALFAGALYLSQAIVGLGLGRSLVRLPIHESRKGINFGVMALGVLVISGLRLIPITGVGVTVAIMTATAGLGAIVLALRGTHLSEAGRAATTRPAQSLFVVIAGCVLGLVITGAAAVTLGAGALWLAAALSSSSTSTQLTLAFDRDILALSAASALAVTLAAGTLAFTIYRRL